MDLQNEQLWRKGMADHPDAEPRREFVEGLERLLIEKARRKHPRTLAWIGGTVGVAAVVAAAVVLFAPTVRPSVQVGFVDPVVANPIVYVYETHNRESFLPETKQETDPQLNITLVGQKLTEYLTEKKIATQHRTADFMQMQSMDKVYDASRAVIENDLKTKESLRVVFDLHRDALPRAQTTAQVDGKDTARIYFIVGKGNPNFAQNEAFAKQVNSMLEELHPGVSRGVWVKAKDNKIESAYNQDLHPHSLVVEIGGPENTLEEEYRAAQYLADAVEATLAAK